MSGLSLSRSGDPVIRSLTFDHVRLYNYKGSWLEWVQKEGHKAGTS